MPPTIRSLAHTPANVASLTGLFCDCIAAGASLHFMHPTPPDKAAAYWSAALADADAGGRIVLGAFDGERLLGTVTLWLDTPPNQPFRGEIWKLMTAPADRGRGVGAALMREAEHLAAEHGRILLNLDTAEDGGAGGFYETLGWIRAGAIPAYAYKPHGGLTGTLIYFKTIEPIAVSRA